MELELVNLTITQGAVYGGVRNLGGTVTITDSLITQNTAISSGGGVSNQNWEVSVGSMTLTNSTVSDNSAPNFGGGIMNLDGEMTLTNTTVSGNTGVKSGGGIFNNPNGNITLENSTVTGNSSPGNQITTEGVGGGILNQGVMSLSNTVVSENSANPIGMPILLHDRPFAGIRCHLRARSAPLVGSVPSIALGSILLRCLVREFHPLWAGSARIISRFDVLGRQLW